MGKGTYSKGKFNLYLAFCDHAVNKKTACLAKIKEASRLLYQATNQQMQFGTLYLLGCASQKADIYIYEGSKECHPCAA